MDTELTDMEEIIYLIIKLSNRICHGVEPGRPIGFPISSKVRILLLLHMRGPQRMTHIAEFCNISLPSATAVVNKLNAARFVCRLEDPKDRRATMVKLLPAGRGMIDQVSRMLEQRVEDLLDHLPVVRKEEFITAANRIHCLLGEILSPHG